MQFFAEFELGWKIVSQMVPFAILFSWRNLYDGDSSNIAYKMRDT